MGKGLDIDERKLMKDVHSLRSRQGLHECVFMTIDANMTSSRRMDLTSCQWLQKHQRNIGNGYDSTDGNNQYFSESNCETNKDIRYEGNPSFTTLMTKAFITVVFLSKYSWRPSRFWFPWRLNWNESRSLVWQRMDSIRDSTWACEVILK